MIVFEVGIHVRIPVQLVDNKIEIFVFVPGHVLHEQTPWDVTALDHALVHTEDVATPLRFVGAETSRRVKNRGADQPTGARLEPIRFGKIKNPVVTFVPILKTFADLSFSGSWFQA